MRALLIGATGLVGREILRLCVYDPRFESVTVFVRRKTGVEHPKLRERIVDFSRMEEWKGELTGDVLFSALGTTRAQAGSNEAQYEVDFTYQLEVARAARAAGVGSYVLISSAGARAGSPVFYLRIKGELEEEVKRLGFACCCILRPGPLSGERERPRTGEKISGAVLGCLPNWRVFRGIRPVAAAKVAETAAAAASGPAGEQLIHL